MQIAASSGPLEASYINEFKLSHSDMIKQFHELMTLLEPYVDIFLGETFSTLEESNAFLTAAQKHDKPAWVSWTLHDHSETNLRGGTALLQAIKSLDQFSPTWINAGASIIGGCCNVGPAHIAQVRKLLDAL